MDLKELQNSVDSWIKEHGVRYFDVVTNTLLLNEEVGELSRLVARKYGEQSFKDKKDENVIEEKMAEEIGDILFVLTCLTNQMGYSLEEIMQSNLQKKTKRDSKRHKANQKLK